MRVWAEIRGDIGWLRISPILIGNYQYATCREDVRHILQMLNRSYYDDELKNIVYEDLVYNRAQIMFSIRRSDITQRIVYDYYVPDSRETEVTHNWMVEGF